MLTSSVICTCVQYVCVQTNVCYVLMYMCVCVYTMHPKLHVVNNDVGTVHT